jgi:PHD/YefM family antitoxin component YafN of YafNO toxin-antitoxin module
MTTVNANEFQKRVREFSGIARRQPVTVPRHGRPAVVLLSAEEYERLKQIEDRATKAIRVSRLPRATIRAIRAAKLSHLPPD